MLRQGHGLPALLGNYDRPTNQPTDRQTNRPTDGHERGQREDTLQMILEQAKRGKVAKGAE